jgi:hypothetical protein
VVDYDAVVRQWEKSAPIEDTDITKPRAALDHQATALVSVHAGGGVFGSLRSVGMGVVEVAIGPGGKVEL